MTPEQYDRWKDFALRAARTWYKTHRLPTGAWVEEVVAEWFACFEPNDIPCIVDWDNSTAYPEGNPWHAREYRTSYCGCDGWRDKHKRSNPDCPECHGLGIHYALERAGLVCDMMSEFLDRYRGYAPRCRACAEYDNDEKCRCDEIDDAHYEQWETQWGDPVRCCIRAGLDCAGKWSIGVMGFTAGDVRAMYPEGVPEWVFSSSEKLIVGFTDPPVENGTFAELPDDALVCL